MYALFFVRKILNIYDLRTFDAKFCRENLRTFLADYFGLKSKIRRHFYFLDIWTCPQKASWQVSIQRVLGSVGGDHGTEGCTFFTLLAWFRMIFHPHIIEEVFTLTWLRKWGKCLSGGFKTGRCTFNPSSDIEIEKIR